MSNSNQDRNSRKPGQQYNFPGDQQTEDGQDKNWQKKQQDMGQDKKKQPDNRYLDDETATDLAEDTDGDSKAL